MKQCACSETVRLNWGSERAQSGKYICAFCGNEQPASSVLNKVESGVLPPRPAEPEPPFNWERKPILDKALESGSDAAVRVFRFGSLFETIGNILQWLNLIGAAIIVLVVLFIDIQGTVKLMAILFIGLIWAFGFLQTSFIRGLASYFQMRSSEYLEKKKK